MERTADWIETRSPGQLRWKKRFRRRAARLIESLLVAPCWTIGMLIDEVEANLTYPCHTKEQADAQAWFRKCYNIGRAIGVVLLMLLTGLVLCWLWKAAWAFEAWMGPTR